jgi:hypothetical protein
MYTQMSYTTFVTRLKEENVQLNRKVRCSASPAFRLRQAVAVTCMAAAGHARCVRLVA